MDIFVVQGGKRLEGSITVGGAKNAARFSDVWRDGFREFRTDRTALCEECRKCDEREFCAGDSTHTWDFDRNQPGFCMMRVIGKEQLQ